MRSIAAEFVPLGAFFIGKALLCIFMVGLAVLLTVALVAIPAVLVRGLTVICERGRGARAIPPTGRDR